MELIHEHLERTLDDLSAAALNYEGFDDTLVMAEHYAQQAYGLVDHATRGKDVSNDVREYLQTHHAKEANEIQTLARSLQNKLRELNTLVGKDDDTRWQDKEMTLLYLQGIMYDMAPTMNATYSNPGR